PSVPGAAPELASLRGCRSSSREHESRGPSFPCRPQSVPPRGSPTVRGSWANAKAMPSAVLIPQKAGSGNPGRRFLNLVECALDANAERLEAAEQEPARVRRGDNSERSA